MRQLPRSLLMAALVAGCASSSGDLGVVAAGPGTYTITKQGATGSAGLGRLRAAGLKDANQYCANNGREALFVGARETSTPYVISNESSVEIDFRCFATQEMREKTKSAVLQCREKRLRKEFRTYKQSVECSNPKILAAYEGSNYPYLDLVRAMLAARLIAAENLDKGAITEVQAQSQAAELESRIGSEDQRRREAADAQAAAATTTDALLQGLSAFQVANRPAKRIPAQRTALNCNTTGLGGGLSTTSCY